MNGLLNVCTTNIKISIADIACLNMQQSYKIMNVTNDEKEKYPIYAKAAFILVAFSIFSACNQKQN